VACNFFTAVLAWTWFRQSAEVLCIVVLVHDMQELGVTILQDLARQRETILHARDTLHGAGNALKVGALAAGRASHVIIYMTDDSAACWAASHRGITNRGNKLLPAHCSTLFQGCSLLLVCLPAAAIYYLVLKLLGACLLSCLQMTTSARRARSLAP